MDNTLVIIYLLLAVAAAAFVYLKYRSITSKTDETVVQFNSDVLTNENIKIRDDIQKSKGKEISDEDRKLISDAIACVRGKNTEIRKSGFEVLLDDFENLQVLNNSLEKKQFLKHKIKEIYPLFNTDDVKLPQTEERYFGTLLKFYRKNKESEDDSRSESESESEGKPVVVKKEKKKPTQVKRKKRKLRSKEDANVKPIEDLN